MELISRALLDEARDNLGESFSVVIGYFFEDGEGYLNEIKSGIANKDLSKIAPAAHTLKSSSLVIGAIRISEIAKKIEYQAKSEGNLDDITLLSNELEHALKETKKELLSELN